jgi:hypothetical protein
MSRELRCACCLQLLDEHGCPRGCPRRVTVVPCQRCCEIAQQTFERVETAKR